MLKRRTSRNPQICKISMRQSTTVIFRDERVHMLILEGAADMVYLLKKWNYPFKRMQLRRGAAGGYWLSKLQRLSVRLILERDELRMAISVVIRILRNTAKRCVHCAGTSSHPLRCSPGTHRPSGLRRPKPEDKGPRRVHTLTHSIIMAQCRVQRLWMRCVCMAGSVNCGLSLGFEL